jgi:hypothetical protein
MDSLAAVRILGGERFLGQDIEAGEQAQSGVHVVVVDVAEASGSILRKCLFGGPFSMARRKPFAFI